MGVDDDPALVASGCCFVILLSSERFQGDGEDAVGVLGTEVKDVPDFLGYRGRAVIRGGV
jgi:hypothetical protein